MFNLTNDELLSRKAYWTAQEIFQQPTTWLKTLNLIANQLEKIKSFIQPVITAKDFDIVFTGAGTSEFAGNALYAALNQHYQYHVHSYATTDLVSAPQAYLSPDKPTLLISFGRSGNSPESVAAVNLADQVTTQLYHLIITCNEQGQLVQWGKNHPRAYTITLAPETHDQSFAMTSSFTNMILAAYLALGQVTEVEVMAAVAKAKHLVEEQYQLINRVVQQYQFKRIVYLGSNALKGIAQESALKMLELTAGQVATMFDSPLGFRHGPKSIINDETLTVLYLSDDQYVRQYEVDLLKEMSSQRKANKLLVVGNQLTQADRQLADWSVDLGNSKLDGILGGITYVIIAQLLALFKSLSLGITPDNPCPSGEVNRVVQGVTVYPYQ